MAQSTIHDLPLDGSPAPADELETEKSPFGTGQSRRIALSSLVRQADIGTDVQAHDPVLDATTAPFTGAASDTTSGTFADARISQTSVTQHQAAIDHDSLTGYDPNKHATPKNSIEVDVGQLQLSGDSAAPGNSKLYGTDGTGTKGWYDQPSGGGSGANLGVAARTATTLDVTSDTGTDATIPQSTGTLAGLQSAADKTKLDGVATGAQPGDLVADNNLNDVTDADIARGNLSAAPTWGTQTQAGGFELIGTDFGNPPVQIRLSTGTSPQIVINNGTGAQPGDMAYVVRNGTGDATFIGSAAKTPQTGGTLAMTAVGAVTVICVATDTFIITGSLVAA